MQIVNKVATNNDLIDRSGLPAWTYNNEEFSDLELEEVTLKNWIFVGHISDIPNPGDYLAFDLASERALVVRDKDNKISAFHNVCRHRASRLVCDQQGNCGKALVCPFHGWTYHLDGRLKQIPRPETFPSLDATQLGLAQIELEIWHGLIFIRFNGEGPTVAERFSGAEAEIALYKISDMQPYDEPWRYDFDLDWKSVSDIDNEGYHLPIGHPELYDLLGRSYRDEQHSSGLSRTSGSFANRKFKSEKNQAYVDALPEESYLPESHRSLWTYWGMFPGFVITLFPDQIEVYQIFSVGYHKSAMAGRCYALNDQRKTMTAARKFNREINNGVGEEDINLVHWSAEGMRSSSFQGVVLGDLECLVVSFQDHIRKLLPVVTLDKAPVAGSLRAINDQLLASATPRD
jgi:phenylpropionate dioxygenase-like ring-hydroxylating dioxygenase large terminal subunit